MDGCFISLMASEPEMRVLAAAGVVDVLEKEREKSTQAKQL